MAKSNRFDNSPKKRSGDLHDEEAELRLLASMTTNEDILFEFLPKLVNKDFFRIQHQSILFVLKEMYKKSLPVSLGSLIANLNNHGKMEEAGGADYINEMPFLATSHSLARHDYQHIRSLSTLRQLRDYGVQLGELVHKAEPAEDLLAQAEKDLEIISEHSTSDDSTQVSSVLDSVMESFYSRKEGNKESLGLQTHFHHLNYLIGGMRNSEFIIIAARPSVGKTTFAMNILLNLSVAQRIPAVLFSLEMKTEQIVNNVMCCLAGIDGKKWRDEPENITDEEMDRIAEAEKRVKDAPLLIDDNEVMSCSVLRAKIRRYIKHHQIKIVFIDYIGLMKEPSVGAREGRLQEISAISRNMKIFSKEFNIPIVCLSQLSRNIEHRQEKRPRMADLRESGSLEQDADIIMLLHRKDYQETSQDIAEEDRGKVDVLVAKNRNGKTGTVRLGFVQNELRFENIAQDENP